MIEQYWPVGEPAENLRALLVGRMTAGGDQKDTTKIWKMLSGTYEPEKKMTEQEIKKQAELTKQQLKGAFGINQ